MNRISKISIILLAMLTLIIGFIACGPDGGSNLGEDPDGKVTLTIVAKDMTPTEMIVAGTLEGISFKILTPISISGSTREYEVDYNASVGILANSDDGRNVVWTGHTGSPIPKAIGTVYPDSAYVDMDGADKTITATFQD